MKKLIVLFSLVMSSCVISISPNNRLCTDLCSDYFRQPIQGMWLGDDLVLEATRCVCLTEYNDQHLMFFWKNYEKN